MHFPSILKPLFILFLLLLSRNLAAQDTRYLHVPGLGSERYILNTDGTKVNRDVRNFKITSFDLVKLKNMSPEWRAFCRDSIEKAFHTTFTDAEIEESSYNDF